MTYTPPGQEFFGSETTRGGWFVASPLLKDSLVAVGFPGTPPVDGDGTASPWTLVSVLTALGAALALAAVAALLARRRPGLASKA